MKLPFSVLLMVFLHSIAFAELSSLEDFELKRLQKEYYQSQIDRNNAERGRALREVIGIGQGLAPSDDHTERNCRAKEYSGLNRVIMS